MDPLFGPGSWTPFIDWTRSINPLFFIFIFHFLFSLFLLFVTKPNHSDWVHRHPIFPSFNISCKEILLCTLLFFVGDARWAAAVFVLLDKMFLLMIGIIKVKGLHDSYVHWPYCVRSFDLNTIYSYRAFFGSFQTGGGGGADSAPLRNFQNI